MNDPLAVAEKRCTDLLAFLDEGCGDLAEDELDKIAHMAIEEARIQIRKGKDEPRHHR